MMMIYYGNGWVCSIVVYRHILSYTLNSKNKNKVPDAHDPTQFHQDNDDDDIISQF